ncbi:MAG: hypothetical protein HKP61_17190 [Dactylosporangium sp.]|nr:hypothetical protein [Dactylosporangium sp.]NNJ62641.1 hypothetical protein [Dactylosporangium sp.]
MEAFELARLDRYFRHVTDTVGPPGPTEARALLVTHLLAERPSFVRAVGRIAGLAAVLPKPKSDDPIRATQALSQGFGVAATRAAAIATAGMVMCATGHLALRRDDFTRLANGAHIASVTSSEDELELHTLDGVYQQTAVADNVTRYDTTGHYFYVLAGGNAVNFLHGASRSGTPSWSRSPRCRARASARGSPAPSRAPIGGVPCPDGV